MGGGEKGAEVDPDVQMTLGRKQDLKDGRLSQVCNKPGSEPGLSLAGEGSPGASELSRERGLRGEGGPGVGSRPPQEGATASSAGPCPRASQTAAHLSLEGKSVGTEEAAHGLRRKVARQLDFKTETDSQRRGKQETGRDK